MLMKTIDLFVSDLKDRVGKDYRYSTYEKYVFMQEKVASFLKQQKIKDVRLKDLKTSFIIDFDHFLRTSENNQHNTAVKYCINLKRVINVAVLRGLIPSSPLNAYKTVYKDTQQIYLNEAELITLQYVALKKQTHKICLDLFLFQCFTGMAYTDMINLENKDISFDDGRKWIIKPRQKSNIVATIPLLHDAYTIIEKYHEYEKKGKFLLPRYSIQKYNQYIGEIGKIAGISKKLSSHAGRRTFGNIALARGVSLNVISKILGHANTLITQRIYAITTQKIISNEIDKLELKE
jgi:integrase